MRLTQLAPAAIEAALRDGRLGAGLSELLGWFPERWDRQLAQFSEDQPARRSTS